MAYEFINGVPIDITLLKTLERVRYSQPSDYNSHLIALGVVNDAISLYHRNFARRSTYERRGVPHPLFGTVAVAHLRLEEMLKEGLHNLRVMNARRNGENIKSKLEQTELEKVNARYAFADEQFRKYLSNNQEIDPENAKYIHAAFRLREFGNSKPRFVFDVDGTVTPETVTVDGVTYPGKYVDLVPASHICDPAMANAPDQRNAFTQVHGYGWSPALLTHEDLFVSAGRLLDLRPGIEAFWDELILSGHDVQILSAGMEPVVRGVLQNPNFNHKPSRVQAVTAGSVTESFKSDKIREMILDDVLIYSKQVPVIFVGDGSSDAPLADPKLPLAFAFALKGKGFSRDLERAGLLHFTYETQEDNLKTWKEIERVSAELEEAGIFNEYLGLAFA